MESPRRILRIMVHETVRTVAGQFEIPVPAGAEAHAHFALSMYGLKSLRENSRIVARFRRPYGAYSIFRVTVPISALFEGQRSLMVAPT
jgi:hypothetical protein